MDTALLYALSIAGTFLVVHLIARQIISSLIDGRLQPLYWSFVRWRTASYTDRAFRHNESDAAMDAVVAEKLVQLSTGSPAQRKLATEYLEEDKDNLGSSYADNLIEALQKQPEIEMKKRVARLLLDVLEPSNQKTADEKRPVATIKPRSAKRLRSWGIVGALWATGLIWLLIIWRLIDTVPDVVIVGFSLLAFAVLVLAITIQSPKPKLVLTVSVVLGALILNGLWLLVDQAHSAISNTRVNLEDYGIAGVELRIEYPLWLTSDDINSCRKPVVSRLVGSPAEGILSFSYNEDTANIKDESCAFSNGTLDFHSLRQRPQSLFWMPKGLTSFRTKSIEITPVLEATHPVNPATRLEDAAIEIKLESLTWHWVRVLGRSVVPTGGAFALLVAAVAFLLKKVLSG